ncbi:MAG: cation transporting ATPase C-terminal domain-containing protein, partial [Coriobacteriaceae bacterium]|nr:cation transporting ATPase C-terminal domain-containing protein [Coriobacteriaceae bacterium]
GRKTYANMIKYIKMTASSNFGNMFSVLIASALLPFLPMQSLHLIILNLIYDLSCTVIPWDNVDEEFLLKPREWNASSVTSFMIWIGPTSSIFDFTTYLFLYFVFCPALTGGITFNDLGAVYSGQQLVDMQTAYVALFNAGWFIESMWTQTLVIHMIRTPKLPFVQSRASAPLMLVTLAGIAVLTCIPYTPLGPLIGLAPPPATFYLYLIPCVLLYMLLATSIKRAYTRHFGELL